MSFELSHVSIIQIFFSSMCIVTGPHEQLLEADALDSGEQKIIVYESLSSCNHTAVRIGAILRLAMIHQHGFYDIKQNGELAVCYWMALSQQRINRSIMVQAYEVLGDSYRDGFGVKSNVNQAKRHFECARDQCPDTDLDIKVRSIEKLADLEKKME